jgi:predicted DNA-binding protein (UPF0251 family)
MGRPKKQRCCRKYHADRVYKPQGIPLRQMKTVQISLDQFEALRLCDVERLEQEEAGRRMGVSRGTVQRLLYDARKKIIEAMIENYAILVNVQESEVCDVGMYPDER